MLCHMMLQEMNSINPMKTTQPEVQLLRNYLMSIKKFHAIVVIKSSRIVIIFRPQGYTSFFQTIERWLLVSQPAPQCG